MTGDGLQDIVLVEPGRVDYWPYLGHGRWGARVTMGTRPRGSAAAGRRFDPRRVLLGDVDGDGLADLVYVEPRRVTVWINQGGNGWSDADHASTARRRPATRTPSGWPTCSAPARPGILWSTDAASRRRRPYRFLDLTGGVKPYLLDRIDNHMGAVTRIRYAPVDRRSTSPTPSAPATRWRTPLPFPVQVVDRGRGRSTRSPAAG